MFFSNRFTQQILLHKLQQGHKNLIIFFFYFNYSALETHYRRPTNISTHQSQKEHNKRTYIYQIAKSLRPHTNLMATSSPLCMLTPNPNQWKPMRTMKTKYLKNSKKKSSDKQKPPRITRFTTFHTKINLPKWSTTNLPPKLKLPPNYMLHHNPN